jgi:sec-independent protein translocase protein TatA
VSIGPFQILVIALVVLVLFGRGRISGLLGDVGKGVKNFREGLAEDDSVSVVAHAESPQPERAADADSAAG